MYDKFEQQKPFALLDTSKYPPEVAGRFNSFITTQFDDSLSVEMQMRSIIKWAIDNFKEMDQTYNDFTEYVIEENLNPFIQFLNDLIEYMNYFIETFDEKYQETILDKMQEWYDNGELETLINESLDTKYHEMDERLTTQLAQTVRLVTPNMTQEEIQDILDLGGHIKFTKGVYDNFDFYDVEHMRDVAFLVKSNTRLIIEPEAEIKMPPTSLDWYNVFYIENKENVVITGGGKLIGDRNEHVGTVGEWGCGIYISGGNNITIDNLTLENFWGDGLTVHRFPRGLEKNDRSNMPKNVTIVNNIFENNRRQGTSIIGLRGGYISNNVFSNTNGTLPSAGLDLETDRHCAIEDVVITGNIFKDNEKQGLLISKRMGHGDEASIKDVKVTDNFFTDNNIGMQIGQSSNITVSGNTIRDNNGSGINLVGANNCTVISNYVENNEGHGIHVWESNKNTVSYNKINKNGSYGVLVTDDSSHNLIHSNDIEENELDGIGVRIGSSNNNVQNNKVTNNALSNNESQIRVYSNASLNTLTGNICRGTESKYGIYVGDATSRANRVYVNNCVDSGTVKGVGNDVSNNTLYHIGNVENDGTWDSGS